MTKSKTTRRALFTSATAILLCVVMLVGTTFAWFTDTASTNVNKIQAGTLKVDLVSEDGNKSVKNGTLTELSWKTYDDRDQTEILWEPGCTYDLEPVVIKNDGNLALKYKIAITGIKGSEKLNNVIDWTIKVVSGENEETIDLATFEGKLGAQETATLTIKGHMQESAGNEYKGESIDGIIITVVAAQDTVEFDSTTDQYDVNAAYPVISADTLQAALDTKNPVVLGADITMPESAITLIWTANVDLNGNELSVPAIQPYGANTDNVVIANGTITQIMPVNPEDNPNYFASYHPALAFWDGQTCTLENVTVNAYQHNSNNKAAMWIMSMDEGAVVVNLEAGTVINGDIIIQGANATLNIADGVTINGKITQFDSPTVNDNRTTSN